MILKTSLAMEGADEESSDEGSETGILTSSFTLAPAFPGVLATFQWLLEPDVTGLREFVSRYSGATVPDSHGVPRRIAALAGTTTTSRPL